MTYFRLSPGEDFAATICDLLRDVLTEISGITSDAMSDLLLFGFGGTAYYRDVNHVDGVALHSAKVIYFIYCYYIIILLFTILSDPLVYLYALI